MQKIEIFFPAPIMTRMRKVAKATGLPVGEIVRHATEHWLEKFSDTTPRILSVPTVDAGRCLVSADEMRAEFYAWNPHTATISYILYPPPAYN